MKATFEPRALCQNLAVPTQKKRTKAKIVPEDRIKHPQLLNPCIKDRILTKIFLLTSEPNVGLHLKTLDVLTDAFTSP